MACLPDGFVPLVNFENQWAFAWLGWWLVLGWCLFDTCLPTQSRQVRHSIFIVLCLVLGVDFQNSVWLGFMGGVFAGWLRSFGKF